MSTRFRLPFSGTAEVSPTVQSYTHTDSTRTPLPINDNTQLTTNALAPDNAGDHLPAGDTFFQQFVSRPMLAGQTFTSGETIKCAVMCLQANAGNHLFMQLFVSVVDRAGTTVQRVLRAKVLDDNEVNTVRENRFLSTTQDGANYTTVAGDWLVVEFSLQGDPVATGGTQGHNGSMRFGSNGSSGDNPEDDTTTGVTFNPWIEFAPSLNFELNPGQQERTPPPPAKKSIGVAALTIGLSLLQSTLAPVQVQAPFTTSDWPTPRAAVTRQQTWVPNLLETTLAPVAEATGQPVTQATTLIQAKKPAPSWDPPNLLQNTLTPAVVGDPPIRQHNWPLPQTAKPRPVDTLQFIGYYVFQVQQDPFVSVELTLPAQRKPAPLTWTQNLLETTLSGPPPPLTVFARPKDWPNPPVKPASLALRTWTQNRPSYYTEPAVTNPPIRQHNWPLPPAKPVWQITSETRIGADDAVVVQAPFAQTDWVTPRLKVSSLDLKTWIQLRPPFYTEPKPFAQTDWPTPKPRKPAPHVWTQNLLESTLGPAAEKPFNQDDWPNPAQRQPAPRDWFQSPAVPSGETPPIRNIEWPIPPRPVASLDLRTWIKPRPSFYVEQLPFSQTNWPNPQPLRPAPKDWTQRPAVPLATPEIRQYDWPNPRVTPAAFGLRTWSQSRPSFYTEPKPFAQLDWPTPKPFKPAPHVWTQSPDVPLGIPLRPLDWPLPRIKAASIDLRTWINKRPSYYVDTTAGLVVTIHTIGLDVFQTLGAGLDIRPDPGAGLDVYATGTAGLDISATPSAGVSDRAAPAGLDVGQSLPAGLSDAT